MPTEPKTTCQSLKDTVIGRLTESNITPRSRWFFRSRECVVWFLWLISVLIGSLVTGILLFLMHHRQYALYEATHDNFLTFTISALPYLWIGVFIGLILVSLYNLRKTKHGYRYSLAILIISSVALSVAGGLVFHIAGYGYTLDRYLGEQMAMYTSEIKKEKRLWQQPAEGRLLGSVLYQTVTPTSTVIFEDSIGGRWRVEVDDLSSEELELLNSEVLVRMFGQPINMTAKIFHACGVFPWFLQDAPKTEQLAKGRAAFLDKSMEYIKQAEEQARVRDLQLKLNQTASSESPDTVCAEMMPVKRVRESMKE